MSEGLISRQAAIDALIKWYGCEPIDIGAFENIIEKLPSAQPAQRWIPCKERLPEKHEEVLVTVTKEIVIAWIYLDGRWRSNDCPETYLNDHITAWMPLPKPYERKEVEE